MIQDFTKPVTLLITGSGDSSYANVEAVLDNLVFHPADEDGRDVTVLVPFDKGFSSPGMEKVLQWTKKRMSLPDGDELIAVVEEGHSLVSKFGSTIRVGGLPDWESFPAQATAIENLLYSKNTCNNEVFYISLYDPEKDLNALAAAKTNTWLTTFNFTGGIDAFEGYESPEEKEIRRKAEEEFKAKQEAESPVPAKKATTPRKRAAKKAVAPEPKAPEIEPEKLVQTLSEADQNPPELPHKHSYNWFDDDSGHSGSFCICGEPDPGYTNQDLPVGSARGECLASLVTVVSGREDFPKAQEFTPVATYLNIMGQPVKSTITGEGSTVTKKGPNPFRDPLPTVREEDKTRAWTAQQWDAAELIKNCSMGELSPEQLQVVRDSGIYTKEEIDSQITNYNLVKSTVTIKKDSLVKLGEAISAMSIASMHAMQVLTEILKEL